MLGLSKLPDTGQTNLWDGRTGEKFDRPITVGVIYIDSILPKNLRASGQAIYSTSLYGLGPSIGLFIAGLLMSSRSTKTLWVMCLFVSVIGCIIVNRAMEIDDQQTIDNHQL